MSTKQSPNAIKLPEKKATLSRFELWNSLTLSMIRRALLSALMIGVGLFILFALMSYSPNDPGWTRISSDTTQITNLMGASGAWFADVFFAFLGLAAWLIPLFFLYELVNMWWIRNTTAKKLRYPVIIFAVLFLAASFSLLFSQEQGVQVAHGKGGILGYELAQSLSLLVGHWISFVFTGLLFLIAFSYGFQVKWSQLWRSRDELFAPRVLVEERPYSGADQADAATPRYDADLTMVPNARGETSSNGVMAALTKVGLGRGVHHAAEQVSDANEALTEQSTTETLSSDLKQNTSTLAIQEKAPDDVANDMSQQVYKPQNTSDEIVFTDDDLISVDANSDILNYRPQRTEEQRIAALARQARGNDLATATALGMSDMPASADHVLDDSLSADAMHVTEHMADAQLAQDVKLGADLVNQYYADDVTVDVTPDDSIANSATHVAELTEDELIENSLVLNAVAEGDASPKIPSQDAADTASVLDDSVSLPVLTEAHIAAHSLNAADAETVSDTPSLDSVPIQAPQSVSPAHPEALHDISQHLTDQDKAMLAADMQMSSEGILPTVDHGIHTDPAHLSNEQAAMENWTHNDLTKLDADHIDLLDTSIPDLNAEPCFSAAAIAVTEQDIPEDDGDDMLSALEAEVSAMSSETLPQTMPQALVQATPEAMPEHMPQYDLPSDQMSQQQNPLQKSPSPQASLQQQAASSVQPVELQQSQYVQSPQLTQPIPQPQADQVIATSQEPSQSLQPPVSQTITQDVQAPRISDPVMGAVVAGYETAVVNPVLAHEHTAPSAAHTSQQQPNTPASDDIIKSEMMERIAAAKVLAQASQAKPISQPMQQAVNQTQVDTVAPHTQQIQSQQAHAHIVEHADQLPQGVPSDTPTQVTRDFQASGSSTASIHEAAPTSRSNAQLLHEMQQQKALQAAPHAATHTAMQTAAPTDSVSDTPYQPPVIEQAHTQAAVPVTNQPAQGVEQPRVEDYFAETTGSRAFATAEHRANLSPIPSIELLDKPDPNQKPSYSPEELARLSELLEIKLNEFNIKAKVALAQPGPVVTRFEVDLAPGVKASKVTNISRDLARSLSMASVRVVEVIPGKPYIGIEVPNTKREMVRLYELLMTDVYNDPKAGLSMALGKDIAGRPVVTDLAKAPHMLVAGTTGSGKSVAVNAMLLSLLLKYTPDQLRLILIDPKQLELANYNDIPHLLTEVVTDMKDAASALNWCVAEMERRYKLMAFLKVRKLSDFNKKVTEAEARGEDFLDPLWRPNDDVSTDKPPRLKPIPLVVVVADEFADMIMQVGKQAEELITRLAQKSRAAGIHLILATQRPSVDVITGLIKANIPTRVALRVNSKVDSRTILDSGGAEDMLGNGDMLFLGPGKIEAERAHGAYISDDEVNTICDAWRERGSPNYVEDMFDSFDIDDSGPSEKSAIKTGETDVFFDEAVAFVMETRKVSASSIQRKFSIGYNRAARIVDAMEAAGLVSSMGKSGRREILM